MLHNFETIKYVLTEKYLLTALDTGAMQAFILFL